MKSLIILFFIFIFFSYGYGQDRILLRDIDILLLHKNEWTIGRRNESIPQLNCIGGEAILESHKIDSIVCKNIGFDDTNIIWNCTINPITNIKLGSIDILYEGYDYPSDPFILKSSCAIKYTLDYKNNTSNNKEKYDSSKFIWLVIILIILFGLLMVLTILEGIAKFCELKKYNI